MKWRLLSLLFLFFVIVGATIYVTWLSGYGSSRRHGIVSPSSVPAKPYAVPSFSPDPGSAIKISFVHFNDLHAHYHPRDYGTNRVSPLALIRGYYDQVKSENPNTLFCSAGDEMEKGSLAELASNGASTIAIYKHLGLDLRAIGNHDFAYGLETLKRFASEPPGIALCANQAIGTNFHQMEIGGVRIGVFSMVGMPWDERDVQYNGSYFEGVACRYDFSAVAQELIAKHRGDVDLLFMLSHLGTDLDRQVATETRGIDFIIGGHSHQLMSTPEIAPNGVVMVQAGSFGEYVGRFDVYVDRTSRRMISHRYEVTRVDPANMTPNLELESVIRDICHRYSADAEIPLIRLQLPLAKVQVAALAAMAATNILGADAAVIDLDTVWGTLQAGPCTRQDLLDCFRVEIEPPGTHGFSSLVSVSLSASDLEQARKRSGKRFVVRGGSGRSGTDMLRVVMQRRTAFRTGDYFSGLHTPASVRFEVEVWEAMARYLAVNQGWTPDWISSGGVPQPAQ